jgi:hypothetical protein
MALTVLLLESIDDNLSRRRAEMMRESPRFVDLGLVIHHCFAVDSPAEVVLDYSNPLAEYNYWDSQGAPLSFDQLLKKLETKILECKPDCILLHTGIVFHRHPNIFFDVLQALKEKYPEIAFGFQYHPSDAHLESNPIFDEKAKPISLIVYGR